VKTDIEEYDAYIANVTNDVVNALKREKECIPWPVLEAQFDFHIPHRHDIEVRAVANHHVALVTTSRGVRLGDLGERAISMRRKQKTWETQSGNEQAVFMAIGRTGRKKDLEKYAKSIGLDLPELQAQMRLLTDGLTAAAKQTVVELLLEAPREDTGR
jgi:hypothetical protein